MEDIKGVPESNDDNIPLAIFEPFDPTKVPMYCKHLVYRDKTEYSFEEMRASKWRKKQEEKDLQIKQQQLERMLKEVSEEKEKLLFEAKLQKEKEQRLLEKEQKLEEKEQKLEEKEQKIETEQENVKLMHQLAIRQQNEEYAAQKEEIRMKKSELNQIQENLNCQYQQVIRDMNRQRLQCNADVKKSNTFQCLTSNSHLAQPSFRSGISIEDPTSEFYTNSLAISQDQTTESGDYVTNRTNVPLKKYNAPFSIYQDQTTENSDFVTNTTERPIKNYNAPFTIYQDQTTEGSDLVQNKTDKPMNNFNTQFAIYQDPKSINNENSIPLKSGMKPLLQCRVPDISKPSEASMLSSTNQTMILPSAESFMEMKSFMKVISTPNSGRRFIPEEDENTCAIQLAYRKPSSAEDVKEPGASQGGDESTNGEIPKVEQESLSIPSKKLSPVQFDNKQIDEIRNADSTAELKAQDQETSNLKSCNRQAFQIPNAVMSPIMETSREYNYRSSSSSESPWHASNKSNMKGFNTGVSHDSQRQASIGNSVSNKMAHASLSKSHFTKSKFLGQIPEETCSGYMADASSARTPGIFLQSANSTEKTPLNGNCINFDDSKNDSNEPTEVIDIMKAFQKEAGLIPDSSKKNFKNQLLKVGAQNGSLLSDSIDISTIATYKPTPSRIETPCAKSILGTPFQLNGDISTADVSLPPAPVLSASQLNIEVPGLELTQASPDCDAKIGINLDLTDKNEEFNPFDSSMQRHLLTSIRVPLSNRHGYYQQNTKIPNIKANSTTKIGPTIFSVKECKGEGAYGKVFRASRPQDDVNPNETIAEMDSVLKVQKNLPNEWEFYICSELHQRLSLKRDTQWFMSIPRCYVFNDGSVFVSEHQPFTLLDVCNKIGLLGDCHGRELLAVYFTIEMLNMLEKLQRAKIIHADIKPENLMLQQIPRLDENATDPDKLFENITPALILIDFGISIDMTLMNPKNSQFYFKFEKEENRIPEMKENQAWTYQIDYYGVAKIAYMILYGGYMEITKVNDRYEPTGKPKRYWNIGLWNHFFETFLNIQNCNTLPDVVVTRRSFESYLMSKYRGRFRSTFFDLSNILYQK